MRATFGPSGVLADVAALIRHLAAELDHFLDVIEQERVGAEDAGTTTG